MSAHAGQLIELRPLTLDNLPRLAEIRPTYRTSTILTLEKSGSGHQVGWRLVERDLPAPFDKGALYDFTPETQIEIAVRLARTEGTFHRVAVFQYGDRERFVGVIDAEIQAWNNTLFIWNLMIDLDFRRQGIGRRLWARALDFARDVGVRAVICETQNTNLAACKFYARMGCELVGINETLYTNDWRASEFALFWAYKLR